MNSVMTRAAIQNTFTHVKKKTSVGYSIDGTRTVRVKSRVRMLPFVFAAVICLLLIPLIIMNALRTDGGTAEWWTQNVARQWEYGIGTLTSVIPFSIFELLLCSLIVVGVYLFVRLVINLCRAEFKKILTGILAIGIAAVYVLNLYTMSMAFGYYRAPMPIKQAGQNYNAHQAGVVARYFVSDYNALCEKFERDENGCVICPYAFGDLAELMRDEYKRVDDPYFFSYTPAVKPLVNSWFLSDLLITGITFLPTGEANLNVDAPPTTVTYTMAHELAHTKGVQREGDANMLSYYVLLTSENDYLRYCGYYATIYSFVQAVSLAGDLDAYAEIVSSMSGLAVWEHRYTSDYWASQPDIMGQIGEFFNNIYLVFNGAENGTDSYNDGNQSSVIQPTDPETGDPIIDPDTEKPVIIPVYSAIQKLYFYIYESACGVPEAGT